MGYPRRFFGADHEMRIGDVIIPARCAVEVTFRTQQQRFLIRPDEETNEIVQGCFGRAYDRYPDLNFMGGTILGNHGCMLTLPPMAWVLSDFMRDFLSSLGRKLNNHRDRDGVVWERRYRAIPIVDEAMLEDRLRYVITQGTKENLVWRARDWPGFSSARTLMSGKPMVGRWRDRTAECALRRQRKRKHERAERRGIQRSLPSVADVWLEYPINHVPLPHWQHLEPAEVQARIAAMLAQDDAETRARHERDGTRPLGVAGILGTSPFARPAESARSPAPLVHASTRPGREAFRSLYRAFLDVLADARERTRSHMPALGVPRDATLPPMCSARAAQRTPGPPHQRRQATDNSSLDPPGRDVRG